MVLGLAGVVASCIGLYLLQRGREWKGCLPLGVGSLDALSYLNPGKDQLKERQKLWRNKLLLGCMVLLGGSCLICAGELWHMMDEDTTEVLQLERPEPGEGEREIALHAWTEEGEEGIPLTVRVKERELGEEEAEKLLVRSYLIIREEMLGENPSADEVSLPLDLMTSIAETGCRVYWYTDNPERIDRNGMVCTEGIEQKEVVNLTAELSAGKHKREYAFTVCVVPGEMSEEEKLIQDIKKQIQQAEQEDGMEKILTLPQLAGGERVFYCLPERKQQSLLWLLAAVLTGLSMFLPEQKLLQEKKKKEEELMLAYPEIVSRLCLLIGSGLTVRKAWERIIQDYRGKKSLNYAYEEMLFTYYELERGLPEGKAYAAFGRRCRLHGYRKLGSLLEQNLKKGTAGLLALLQEETWQAFEDRRAFAVRLAQEAGTRMLLPMILLLAVVLIICIAPAVMSF